MEAFDIYRNELVNNNKKTFSEFQNLKWLGAYQSEKAQLKRNLFTQELEDNWLFKKTKLYYKQISKGCMICGLGTWSCLFITGKCNASCFYCPAPQLNDEVPTTQNLLFETPESYAEYINYFGFKGVSFSGGEPLLFFERTLQYLKQIRKKCSPDIYIWLYTNGISGDEQKFKKLASEGINEVRFDIGATGFKLDKLNAAKGIIPNLTIEIPAVPEEKEKLKQLLPKMIKTGVSNLNLHQLRLTKHNAPRLMKRNYTYIHVEQPVVLESELTALEILNYARKNNFDIGINYCSFYFKNRFQKAGFRRQIANVLAGPDEKGCIRNYNQNSINYNTLILSDKKTNHPNYPELDLLHKSYTINRETVLKNTPFTEEQKTEIDTLLAFDPEMVPNDPLLFKIWQMEYIEKGLRPY